MAYKVTYYTDNGDYTIKGYERTELRSDVRVIKSLENFIADVQHECKRLDIFACITCPDGSQIWCGLNW